MKKLNDEQFEKMKISQKYKELFDFSTVETRAACVLGIISLAISFVFISVNGKEAFITDMLEVYKDIGIALIGFLGFSVAGLAILIGAISSKVAHYFKKNSILSNVEDILGSFYFIGFCIAVEVMLIFVSYILSKERIESVVIIDVTIVTILTYLFSFILFYSVGLIGNCISMFSVIIDVEESIDEEHKSIKEIYDSYRIVALEYVILTSSDQDKYLKYSEKVKELIKKDINTSSEQKDKLLNRQKRHFDKWMRTIIGQAGGRNPSGFLRYNKSLKYGLQKKY